MTLNDLLRERLLQCNTLEEIAGHLEAVLTEVLDAKLLSDGSWQLMFGRSLVDRKGRLSIQILPKDHAPAHFHVIFGREVSAKFRLDNCDYISGTINNRDRKKVRCWFESLGAQQKLNEEWMKMQK